MRLRALQNPVRSARIVGHKGNTLTLEVETERGRYRWEVRPVRNFQMLRIERDFKRDWKAALKELIAESVGVYPTRLNSGRSDGWIYHPDLSTPNAQVFSKRMAPGHVIGVHQTNRGADWFVYERRKTVMRGASNSMSYAMRHAEDAYRQWQSGKPRMMFNPKPSKAGWTWTPHHSYRNVWHGNHREFAALVEKSYGEYWEWRVWKVRTAKDIGSGREETRKGAFREVEKASRKYSGFLFNEKSRWKNIGAGEYARSFHGFALRVRYGRVFRRYNWEIYLHGAFKVADEGSSESFPGAKKAAEQAALSRRTLFNPRLVPARWWIGIREDGTPDLHKAKSTIRFPWVNVVGPFTTKKDALKELSHRKYMKRKPRTLFNPAEWLKGRDWQRHGSVLQRPIPTGLLQVARTGSGRGFIWTYWQHLLKTDQYQERIVTWTSFPTEKEAKADADKWYMKRYKGPITLFNAVRK